MGDFLNQQNLFDEMISQAIDLIYRKLSLDYVLLWIVEDDSRILYKGIGRKLNILIVQQEKVDLQIDGDIVDRVISSKDHVIVRQSPPKEDILKSHDTFPETRSILALPLFASASIIGVLELGSAIPIDFREDEIDVFEFLAYQMAKILVSRSSQTTS